MSTKVEGVIVITRNGDRIVYQQDPETYKGGPSDTTPLGEASVLIFPLTYIADRRPRFNLMPSAPFCARLISNRTRRPMSWVCRPTWSTRGR